MDKVIFKICLLFIIGLLVFSCKRDKEDEERVDPTADFTQDVLSGYAPLTVQLTNKSLHAETYFWSFGDGSSSTETNPVHTYNTPGYHTIKLSSSNKDGIAEHTGTIWVKNPVAPVCSFHYTRNEENPLSFSFTNNSSESESILWSFGDGETASGYNTTHTYEHAGDYTVCVSCSNPYGSCDTCIEVEAVYLPYNADLEEIKLLSFPAGNWDQNEHFGNENPDLYIKINGYTNGYYYENVLHSDLPLPYNCNFQINRNDWLTIILYEYDPIPNTSQQIAMITYNAHNISGTPNELVLTSGYFSVKLILEWQTRNTGPVKCEDQSLLDNSLILLPISPGALLRPIP